MTSWQLLAVAAVQGLTEFLPISSSAHLILLPRVLGVADQGLRVDVAAHLGTFVAAILYFRADLRLLWRSLVPTGGERRAAGDDGRRLLIKLLIASVPVMVAGWWFRDEIASVARSPRLIAATSVGFGLVLWLADRVGRETAAMTELGRGGALAVGVAQALALIPGTSRSGATISAGLFCGLRRPDAARFSFLLSIPVGLAVGADEVLELSRAPAGAAHVWQLLAVAAVAGLTGYLCIHFFLRYLRQHELWPFVLYRVALGIAVWIAFVV